MKHPTTTDVRPVVVNIDMLHDKLTEAGQRHRRESAKLDTYAEDIVDLIDDLSRIPDVDQIALVECYPGVRLVVYVTKDVAEDNAKYATASVKVANVVEIYQHKDMPDLIVDIMHGPAPFMRRDVSAMIPFLDK